MQMVIEIDDGLYNRYMNYTENYVDFMFFGTEEKIVRAIRNGTPLPKGHGRLIDLDALIDLIAHNEIGVSAFDGMPMISVGQYSDGDTRWEDLFTEKYVPTIIEKDKENE